MRTPLYTRHVESGAKMATFAGWEMPIEYEGIVVEHWWTRNHASVFDTCHMGEFSLRGPRAAADLERLLTQRVSDMEAGQARYGYLLREDGGCLDDLMCYRLSEDHFWLVVNAATRQQDAEWIKAHLSKETRFEDISGSTAKLDIQGPRARAELEKALGDSLPPIRYFRFLLRRLGGIPMLISRSGYTGEFGYELFLPVKAAVDLWDEITKGRGIKPAGLGARDTLRLEAGFPLYGHELSVHRTPVAVSRGRFIDFNKEFFGKAACLRDRDQGCAQYLCGLQLSTRRAARAGDKVLDGDKEVGEVTSGSYAPSLGVAVALAFVDAGKATAGTKLSVESRGTRLEAEIVELPFYKKGTARLAL